MSHTAGPWHRNIKPARKYAVIFAGRNTHVATLCTAGLTDAEIEGNCDLITSAPKLCEQVQTLREALANLIEQATLFELETLYTIRPTYRRFVADAIKALEETK